MMRGRVGGKSRIIPPNRDKNPSTGHACGQGPALNSLSRNVNGLQIRAKHDRGLVQGIGTALIFVLCTRIVEPSRRTESMLSAGLGAWQ